MQTIKFQQVAFPCTVLHYTLAGLMPELSNFFIEDLERIKITLQSTTGHYNEKKPFLIASRHKPTRL